MFYIMKYFGFIDTTNFLWVSTPVKTSTVGELVGELILEKRRFRVSNCISGNENMFEGVKRSDVVWFS